MSIENEMTARAYGKILAEGMSICDCNLEGVIESEALSALKEIETVILSDEKNSKKVEKVKGIIERGRSGQ